MTPYEFITYISVLSQQAVEQETQNMSKEDQILQGKCNDIASIDDLKGLTR